MSSITDSVGEGWDKRRVSKYFKKENNIENQQQEVLMATSKHFETAHILFFNDENSKYHEWE